MRYEYEKEPLTDIKDVIRFLKQSPQNPYYDFDTDYTTNSPNYYDYLAKLKPLIQILAERIYDYDRELAKRFEEWDKNLEELPDELKRMFLEWVDDGTLARILEQLLLEEYATKEEVNALLKVLENELNIVMNDFYNFVGDTEKLGQNFRSISDTISEYFLNALDFGVKNDGTPTSKDVQEFITYCEENNKNAYFPSGTYLIEKAVYTRSQDSYFYTPGLIIKGAGKNTIFKGTGANPVNYKSSLQPQALFNIHSNNLYISDIMFRDCQCAIYVGEDKKTTELSHSSFMTMERLWFQKLGTGIILEANRGIYYNKFRDIHISEFQIGVDMMKTTLNITQPNNNRNFFEGFRLTRGWIGFSVVGDGNTFNACYGENITGNQAIGVRPTWEHLTHDDVKIDNKAVMWLLHDGASNNRFIGGSNEQCELDVYDAGYKNHYFGNRFDDFSTKPKIIFTDLKRTPGSFVNESTKIGNIYFSPNPNKMFDIAAGSYVDGGKIYDKGYYKKPYNVKNNIIGVTDIHSQTKGIFSKLGRILRWTVSTRFKANNENEPIKLQLPDYENLSVDDVYLSSVLTEVTMSVGFVFGGNSDNKKYLKPLYACFIREDNKDYLCIYPDEQWGTLSNNNVINFDLEISVNNK